MKRGVILFILMAAVLWSSCSLSVQNDGRAFLEKREISPLDLHRSVLDVLPSYDPYLQETHQVDLRGYDLTGLELHDCLDDLMHADFDTATKWPYWLPDGFNPKKILKNAKNPGLGVDALHARGLTGKGISVAIIDDVLLTGHEAFRVSLTYYEEINCGDRPASVSGCQQASILAGKDMGLAPDAKLYYIAIPELAPEMSDAPYLPEDPTLERLDIFQPLVEAIDRIVEINEGLEADAKIRVLCIGREIPKDINGSVRVEEAIGKAQDAGIFVVSDLLYETSDLSMDFNGLNRDPLGDPDDFSSYKPGHTWLYDLLTFGTYLRTLTGLLVPTDGRTTAAPTGLRHYAYYADSDLSLGIPFIGGLYALACQAWPSVTPVEFWEAAIKTGETHTLIFNGRSYSYGRVINPTRLIRSISGE